MKTFYLLIRHCGKFSALVVVSSIMTYIGKALIISFCVWMTLVLVENMHPEVATPIIPAVFIAIVAYYTSCLFLSIYDYSSLTILHCFILDEEGGRQ